MSPVTSSAAAIVISLPGPDDGRARREVAAQELDRLFRLLFLHEREDRVQHDHGDDGNRHRGRTGQCGEPGGQPQQRARVGGPIGGAARAPTTDPPVVRARCARAPGAGGRPRARRGLPFGNASRRSTSSTSPRGSTSGSVSGASEVIGRPDHRPADRGSALPATVHRRPRRRRPSVDPAVEMGTVNGVTNARSSSMPVSLDRRFEAAMFDWDGTAVADRDADASAVRNVVESLCAGGVDVAIVSGTHLENVDGQLGARPSGPGRLLMALNRGSELFEVGRDGPRLLARRQATGAEDAALTRAAELTVARLAAQGLTTRIVSQRLNRRKIDLIPEPEWADPPKSEIDRLLVAVEDRLHRAGVANLAAVAELATEAAREAGIADPRVTSDAKHVEIGLTDKTDSARAVFAELWADGIWPEQVVIGGDEFGAIGGMPRQRLVHDDRRGRARGGVLGRDRTQRRPRGRRASRRRARAVPRAAARSVGTPRRASGGGRARRLGVGRRRIRSRGRAVERGAAHDRRRRDRHQRRAPVHPSGGAARTGRGGRLRRRRAAHRSSRRSAVGRAWRAPIAPDDRVRRVLDLRTGLLGEDVRGDSRMRSVRFSSLARPGVAVLRADVDPPEQSPALAAPAPNAGTGAIDGYEWMTTQGDGGSITAAGWQHRDADRLDRMAAYVVSDGGGEPERAVARLGRGACERDRRVVGRASPRVVESLGPRRHHASTAATHNSSSRCGWRSSI